MTPSSKRRVAAQKGRVRNKEEEKGSGDNGVDECLSEVREDVKGPEVPRQSRAITEVPCSRGCEKGVMARAVDKTPRFHRLDFRISGERRDSALCNRVLVV